MRGDRRQQIVDLAGEYLQTLGYGAFSYKNLSKKLGITKAAIHHHFPTKEELAAEAMRQYHANVRASLADSEGVKSEPWDQLNRYLEQVEGICDQEICICAAGSIQSEHNSVPESVNAEAAKMIQFLIGWVTEVLERGREQGVMDFPGDSRMQATLIFTAVQGALQLGRAQGKATAKPVFNQIRQNLQPKEAVPA